MYKQTISYKKNKNTSLDLYLKEIAKYKILSKAEEFELGTYIQQLVKIERLKEEHSIQDIIKLLGLKDETELNFIIKRGKKSHDKLVCANLRLVVFCAKSFFNKNVLFEDLIEEGNLGLYTACYRFDPNYGTKLSTYAVPSIKHSIQIHLRKQSKNLYLPYNFSVEYSKITEASYELTNKLGRLPNDIEISKHINIRPSRIRKIKFLTQPMLFIDSKVTNSQNIDSLDDRQDSFLSFCYVDEQENIEEYVDQILLKEKITKAISRLEPEEQKVICYRYGLLGHKSLTIVEISNLINKTREAVRQLEYKALDKIRWQGELEDFQ